MPAKYKSQRSLTSSHGDLTYTITWENRKNICLRILADLSLKLSVPLRCTMCEAEQFIINKKGWIYKKRELIKKRSIIKSQLYPEFKDKEVLSFYNERLVLRILVKNEGTRNTITREGNELILKIDTDSTNRELIKNWYIKNGKEVFKQRVDYYSRLMGVSFGNISVKDQRSRWGSCSSKGNLNFCWKLLLLPERLLDYVVVHELAHRFELGHTKQFWAKVAEILPDYKILEHELNKY